MARTVQKTSAKKTIAKADSGPGVFARRLRQAQQASGMTFAEIASRAEFDEMSSSARMSQYATGTHTPRFQIAIKLAKAVGVPVEYFYSADDSMAELLLALHPLPRARRAEVLQFIQGASSPT